MTSFFLPDINVWLALNYAGHQHHATATAWFYGLPNSDRLCFCRHTQMGLMRLMNNRSVVREDARYQDECWSIVNAWMASGKALFLDEPELLDTRFYQLTSEKIHAPQRWADMYLAAFAETAGLPLVTLDKALARASKSSILLS